MRHDALRSCRVVLLATVAFVCQPANSPGEDVSPVSPNGLWAAAERTSKAVANAEPQIRPEAFALFAADLDALEGALKRAPDEAVVALRDADAQIILPKPDGTFARFRIVESPVMAPALAAKFPQIQTYIGQGIDDPAATARLDWTPAGFHAQVLSPEGAWYIDPYWKNDTGMYASYYKRDHRPAAAGFSCSTRGGARVAPGGAAAAESLRSGEELRTYRLACAATGEYTQFHGGTVAAGMAAIVTAVNRVTGIYEAEVAVRMILVADNDLIVYTNFATDPYTNASGGAMLSQNQSNLSSVIGTSNYDIGHVFSTGGGGVAGLGVVCRSSGKAWGVTGLSSPIGDSFYVDYVAHEMGHQFGGRHTFNGINGSCCCGNRSGGAAYEPGSGSTIMAYAGICGPDDLQDHSDPYFHSMSFDEIRDYVTGFGDTCSVVTTTGNDAPLVFAGPNHTIPQSTPFVLTASGNDPNGDPLTYGWEERDLGPAAPLDAQDDGQIPLFRTFNPTTDPSRTFPRLSDVLSGTRSDVEKLPTTNRTMDFRVTARDNRAGGGGVEWDEMRVTVDAASGPFWIISPMTTIPSNTVLSVTWAIAGTDGPPVSTSHVDILLSTDDGVTFPTVLASNTPNDGSETVTIPDVPTSLARIKVESVGNVFFAISGVCPPAAAPQLEPDPAPKNRYLSFVPVNPGANVALQVTATHLPVPFQALEGRSFWVTEPQEICENSGHGPEILPEDCGPAFGVSPITFWSATLDCQPHYADWNGYGTIHVQHQGILPGGTYEIRAIDERCAVSHSAPLELTTSVWGDVCGPSAMGSCLAPPDGVADVTNDVLAVLGKFAGTFPLQKARTDLEPGVLDSKINVANDVLFTLDAFTGGSYPFDAPEPCP